MADSAPKLPWDQALARIDIERAAGLVEAFGGRAGSARFVRTSANLVLRFEAADGQAFLRVLSEGLRSSDELGRAQHFLASVAAAGAQVCHPLRTQDGALVASQDDLLATAVRGVPGRTLDRDERSPAVFEAWGRSLGSLHVAANHYEPPPGPPPLRAERIWRLVAGRLSNEAEPVRRAVAELDAWLEGLPEDARGMTHADNNASNVVFDGDEACIIDFDEPQIHWWAADVSRPLREMRHLDAGLVRELHAAFLAGYRSHMPLSQEMEAAIPHFVRMKDLEVLGWLVSGNWAGSRIPGGIPLAEELHLLRTSVVRPLP